MEEARQGQLLGAHRAAGVVGRLEHGHLIARLGEPDRGGEPVGPGADHDGSSDPSGVHGRARETCSANWWSMLSRATSPSPQKACWAPPDPPIGLLDVPGHRIPGPGRPHPGAVVVRVQHQAVVSRAHEVALVGGEVKADKRLAALRHGPGSSSP